MLLRQSLSKLLQRLRYPVSLPDDIASDLGIVLPSTLSFRVFVDWLPTAYPSKIRKWMPRGLVERSFQRALKKEFFPSCSLFSYYFNQGWVVFALYFDEGALLRRIIVHCPVCEKIEGFELNLEEDAQAASFASTVLERI